MLRRRDNFLITWDQNFPRELANPILCWGCILSNLVVTFNEGPDFCNLHNITFLSLDSLNCYLWSEVICSMIPFYDCSLPWILLIHIPFSLSFYIPVYYIIKCVTFLKFSLESIYLKVETSNKYIYFLSERLQLLCLMTEVSRL